METLKSIILVSRPGNAREHERAINELIERLGLSIGELPFPALEVPPYAAAEEGGWKLGLVENPPPLVRGYFSGLNVVDPKAPFWVLLEGSQVWMSVAPMELESNAQMVHEAKGRVLVAGLGMGVTTWNLLIKDDVEEVVVCEKNPHVIELMRKTLKLWKRKLGKRFDKLTVLVGDILERPMDAALREPFHYVLLDIWLALGANELREDLLRCAKLYPNAIYGAWGIEADFVEWMAGTGIPSNKAREIPTLFVRYCSEALAGIRMVGHDEPRMAALAQDAVVNQYLA
jgi:hypothetical protein